MARFQLPFTAGVIATSAMALILGGACTSLKKTSADEPKAEARASATTAPDTTAPPSSSAPENAAWSVKMQSLSGTLSDLLPLVASKKQFNDPANLKKIETSTRNLGSLAHSLKSGDKPNNDPAMKVMSGLFAEDIERALDSLKSGNRDYARQILKDTTSYCIQCHTQTANGPSFPRLNLAINTSQMNKIEQGEFFTATRQFDRALAAYLDALTDEKLIKADPFQWEQVARSALAIVVRVKNDPAEAAKILNKIESQNQLPSSTKNSLTAWKKSLAEWKAEEKAHKNDSSQMDRLKYAERLIDLAKKQQEFPLDHSQDILYFRASSLAHSFMQDMPRGPRAEPTAMARALYLAGVSAEATRDMNFWTLHETYYEQCIRALPHSGQAMSCLENLKDSITLGYSGSAGTRIPPEINQRLQAFETLATPEGKKETQQQ